MSNYLKVMENLLSEGDKKFFKRIYEPQVVAVPPADTYKSICIMPDGEIRVYGYDICDEVINARVLDADVIYLSSYDCGMSWKKKYAKGKMGAATYIEEKGIYMNFQTFFGENKGTFAAISKLGPDDENPEIVKISDKTYFNDNLPLKSEFSDRVWTTAQTEDEKSAFIYTDDFGKTWNIREIDAPPLYETTFPHKGARWVHSYAEPKAVELSENEMMMIVRTSNDFFYVSYSHDNGTTWTKLEESKFHGTNTTPFLLRLSDKRIVCFWNNTQPLPELNHKKQYPPLDETAISGRWEDVFTNRDAAHVAISEDGGESWIGCRELILNEIRNNADFRVIKYKTSVDKSVHQLQAVELPYGKILVSAGQNEAARRLLIFDINWLYEKSRSEEFEFGLGNVSTHLYVKSISGGHIDGINNGHCSWNRTNGALLVPDPETDYKECLLVSKHYDERLYSNLEGVVWNYPASKKGKVSVSLKIAGDIARITLSDRWFNPCDKFAGTLSPFYFELDADDVGDKFVTIDINYDTELKKAEVYLKDEKLFNVKMNGNCDLGLSYLIIQCIAEKESKGTYIRKLENIGE